MNLLLVSVSPFLQIQRCWPTSHINWRCGKNHQKWHRTPISCKRFYFIWWKIIQFNRISNLAESVMYLFLCIPIIIVCVTIIAKHEIWTKHWCNSITIHSRIIRLDGQNQWCEVSKQWLYLSSVDCHLNWYYHDLKCLRYHSMTIVTMVFRAIGQWVEVFAKSNQQVLWNNWLEVDSVESSANVARLLNLVP